MTSSVALTALIASGLPPNVEPWVPAVMPLAAASVARTGADRKAAAERLGKRHDVGRNSGALMGEQLAGAAHAALDLVEYQEETMLVAELAQRAQERRLDGAHAALAHHRLDHDRRRLAADGALDGIEIAEWNLIEAFDRRAETLKIFLLAAGGERRQRPAVEGAFKGDDAIALRRAIRGLIFARAS